MTDQSIAPWTGAEVASLNDYQASAMMHPFTCGNDSSHHLLQADAAGWACPCCDYRQNWAFAWMADGSWRYAFPELPPDALRRRADA
jgi:hypothetical protein